MLRVRVAVVAVEAACRTVTLVFRWLRVVVVWRMSRGRHRRHFH